jgi:hypothetical protein
MKSYTDINQSKKLAEILPLESADMHYPDYYFDGNAKSPCNTPYREAIEDLLHVFINPKTKRLLPCWSLAALINIIPQEIFDGEYIINITEGRNNRWVLTYDGYDDRNPSYYGLSTGADNLIDACTNIIIKLKERNII